MLRTIGIDPGTLRVGYGIVEGEGSVYRAVDSGCIRLSSKMPFPERLKKIYDELSDTISRFNPDEFAIEDLFYAENAKVAIKMGHARGVVILAAVNRSLAISEYSPREVKQAVVGNGAASKTQVQRMVTQLLKLQTVPEPMDVSDALAVAVCHFHRRNPVLP
jgi:crossover junction endodeoxyribonuclease RuvC